MLASIHPLGERARGQRFGVTAAAYVGGSVAGGTGVAVVVASAGWLATQAVDPAWPVRALALAAAALVALAFDTPIGALALPTRHHQVDEGWLDRYRGWVYGAGFGVQLGIGVLTIVTSATVYLMLLAAFLTATPAWGALIGAAFGLSRALVLLLVAPVHSPQQLRAVHLRLGRWSASARRAVLGLELLVAASAIAAVAVAA